MKKITRRFLFGVLALVLLGVLLAFTVLPGAVARRVNAVAGNASIPISGPARELHQRLLVADLHADALLWNRDLLERGTYGHVDVPRLIEGNVALQAFTVVTKVPVTLDLERNSDRTDVITVLAITQRWPPATWNSLKQRALYQARKLHEAADRSSGRLVLIKTATDLETYLARRQRDANVVAGFLGIEGAHALEGDLANVDTFFKAGFRMIGPVHFFDNEMGGSAHGIDKGGLTKFGRQVIARMEQLHMLVDLAHASPAMIDDILDITTRPVVVSHTGVKGTCDNTRNLSDDHLRRIAQTGGVIGIGFWPAAVCGTDARAIARAIRYATNLVGIDHVGLGSDFDGAVRTPFDASGMVQITEALMREGFSEEEIQKIMGGNVIRLLLQALPPQ